MVYFLAEVVEIQQVQQHSRFNLKVAQMEQLMVYSRGGGNVSTNISIGATTNFSSSATGTNNFAAGNAALYKANTTGINNTAIG
jgi:hypothetical protein